MKGKKEKITQKHISFSVSAGAYPYLMGVACYLAENYNLENIHFSGASGGTFPAVLLAAEIDLRQALEVLCDKGPNCCKGRYVGAYGVYDKGMKDVFHHLTKGMDLPKKINHKVSIFVTRLALGFLAMPTVISEGVSVFTSNTDVIEAIVASSLIPFALNGRPFVIYRNWICVDAGLTNVTGVLEHNMATAVALHKEDIERASSNFDRSESYHTPIAPSDSKDIHASALIHATTTTTPSLFPNFSPNFSNGKMFNRRRSDTEISCETASSSLYEYSNQYGLARLGHLILKVLPIKASFVIEIASCKANAAKDNVIDYMGERFASIALMFPPCLGRSLVSKLPPVISDKIKVNIRNKKKKGDDWNNNKTIESENEELWRNYSDIGIDIDDNGASTINETKDTNPSWYQNINQIIGEMMKPKSLSLSESESFLVEELGIGNSHLASTSKDACLLESSDDDDDDDTTKSKIDDTFQALSNGRLWPETHRPTPIKKLPNGAKLLELAPWTWRAHPIMHYNLTGDPEMVRKLFQLGYEDAQAHADDLNRFFKR